MEYNDRPAIAGAFSRSELELLFSAEIPSILIRAQGEDVRLVLTSTFATQEVLVPASSQILSVKDLRGQRVGVQAGTSSHFGLFRILSTAGLQPSDINLSLMQAAEGRVAFESGRLDAWAAWAPWVETQEVAGRGRTLPGGGADIYSVGTVRNEFLRSYPAQSQALFDVIQHAKSWILEHPTEAQQIVAKELGFDGAVVERAWPKFHWDAQLTQDLLQDFQAKSEFLAAQGLTREGAVVNVQAELIDFRLQQNKQ